MSGKFKKIISIIPVLTLIFLLGACGNSENSSDTSNDVISLSFKSASGYDYLKSIDGQTVTISGYMATSSPVDGSFIFLMNLPYQSCPFCVPNTSQLSNTMEIYPKSNETFDYTTQAIKVTGTLVVAENEDEPFTDEYGYEFNFKIIDAEYTIIDSSELSDDMVLWQKIAQSDVITDIYSMYDYVNFLCSWNTYYVNTYTNDSGETVKGYYLYPQDALNYLTIEDAQWNYGYKDGYFDDLIASVKAVDETAFSDLVANIEKAQALAEKALNELESGNYTYEYQYIEQFDNEDYVYTLTNGEELQNEMNEIYNEFTDWLGNWEL